MNGKSLKTTEHNRLVRQLWSERPKNEDERGKKSGKGAGEKTGCSVEAPTSGNTGQKWGTQFHLLLVGLKPMHNSGGGLNG